VSTPGNELQRRRHLFVRLPAQCLSQLRLPVNDNQNYRYLLLRLIFLSMAEMSLLLAEEERLTQDTQEAFASSLQE
jgi:hypothetical protein